jgi:hypothetical protein
MGSPCPETPNSEVAFCTSDSDIAPCIDGVFHQRTCPDSSDTAFDGATQCLGGAGVNEANCFVPGQ